MTTRENENEFCFKLPSGERLVIGCPQLAVMEKYKQHGMFSLEAGGLLFAKIGRSEVEVLSITKPSLWDMRTRFGFRMNKKHRQKQIDKHYEQGLHFIGQWHTHPEPWPKPSSVDLNSMDEMTSLSEHALYGFIMVIVGNGEGKNSIHASIHTSHSWTKLLSCTK
jgi:integrative and conjugative element protein (TIGR02256 family)